MVALKTRLRARLVYLLAIVFALLADGALAQEPAAEAPEEQPTEIQAIPLESVSQRAESLAADLLTMLPSARSEEQERAIEAEFERLEGDIASRMASAESALAIAPSVSRLKDHEQQLLGLRQRLFGPDEEMDLQIAELSQVLARLEASSEIWKKTADQARSTGASEPTLQRIASMQREIGRGTKQVASRRNEILTRRDKLVDPAALLDRTIARVREAIAARIDGMLSLDRPPVWSPKVRDKIAKELGEGGTDRLSERTERLAQYIEERQRLIAFQLALFVALFFGLRSIGARVKAHAEENYDLREAELVFGLPTATALVIVLSLTPHLHPLAPSLFRQIAFMSVVFPAALIVHRLSPSAMTPLVLGLPVFFLTDRFRDIMQALPTLERLVFLVELVAAMSFVLWLVRPKRLTLLPVEMMREPFSRVVGAGMRVAIGLLGVAIFAEAIGLGNLSELVGNGSLRAAYVALFAYAMLKVLQSVLAYALVLRPLRLLRIVSRNRALIRRRLDRVIQVLAVLGWAIFVLTIFEIAEPAQSALANVLGSSLGVGALTISLGNLVVFSVAVWLSFRLANFVNFVLREDVFSRMDVHRGVPYAVSNLVRYTLIFVGFLVALAAGGVQLSNLTVIAGGLGVGIGFGLQNVVNNFVSGLILLFERPLNVGDVVQLQNQDLAGEIRRIGIRASVIRTWQGAEVIVPNSQLVSDSVTNWTLSDRRRRVELNVGVEYGTDAQRVLDLLVEVARANPHLLAEPKPVALFLGFGDSSLDFRLRTWISDYDEGFMVRSELAVAIQRALADAGISVPFPQRDLHLRTLSPDAASKIGSAGEAAARGSSDETR